MHFEKNYIYHVYNRSNQKVFFDRSNYLFFLSKIRKHIAPIADIFSYCLMPNHFHLLILTNENGLELIAEKHRPNTQEISKQIGVVLTVIHKR